MVPRNTKGIPPYLVQVQIVVSKSKIEILYHSVTVPTGTDEERGLTRWRQTLIKHEKSRRGPDDPYSAQKSVYQIPALSTYLKKFTWTKYIPFLPTFDEDLFKVKNRLPGRKNKKEKSNKNSTTCSGDGNNRVIDTAV